MLAEQRLREANLEDALAQLQQQVRADPSNVKHRIFLFQLLAVLGQWDRALNQLNVAAELDPGALAMAQVYREALRCEALRADVFAGRRSPVVFGDPERWVALLIEALRIEAEGHVRKAEELRDEAFDLAPATPGSVDGQPFDWIADADTRTGPTLEVVLNGRYCWVPFHRVSAIDLEAPADLRDVVWMPAHFRWVNGGEAVGLIPSRYPGTQDSEDGLIRLARKTDWIEAGPEVHRGIGQRMLATDAGEYPLMDVRRIALEVTGG
jgi:type VI secretion system protein ImpE